MCKRSKRKGRETIFSSHIDGKPIAVDTTQGSNRGHRGYADSADSVDSVDSVNLVDSENSAH